MARNRCIWNSWDVTEVHHAVHMVVFHELPSCIRNLVFAIAENATLLSRMSFELLLRYSLISEQVLVVPCIQPMHSWQAD